MKTILLSFVLFNLITCVSLSKVSLVEFPFNQVAVEDAPVLEGAESSTEVIYPNKFIINTRVVIEGAIAKPIGENEGDPLEQIWALTASRVVEMFKESEKHFAPLNLEFHISRIEFATYSGSYIEHRLDSIRHPEYMNVYFCLPNDLIYIAISTFPWEDYNRGIVLGYDIDTSTLVHEIGHYCGLFHTFSTELADGEECVNPLSGCMGDLVQDTPEQSDTSCSVEGSSNCGNFMNYCSHKSLSKSYFTPGQYERMKYYLVTHRVDNLLFDPVIGSVFDYGVPKNQTIRLDINVVDES